MGWLNIRSQESEMCFYRRLIMYIELNILVFLRSIRESNFLVYRLSIRSLMKWYFALDHYNYARWLTVHLFDLFCIDKTCPDIYAEFMEGNFAYLKTNSQFSKMAPDQLHDQNNEKIKGVGGAVHLVNRTNESGLIKWELCGPEIVRLVEHFENCTDAEEKFDNAKKHHEIILHISKDFVMISKM